MKFLQLALIITLFHASHVLKAQVVFEAQGNGVYEFLEEMAAERLIHLNSFAKPYARTLIAAKLDSIRLVSDQLNTRQRDMLNFYLKDYGKELYVGKEWDRRRDVFYYSDSTFNFTVNPILGASLMYNENGSRTHRRVGAAFFSNFKSIGIYGSLRDNSVSEPLALPEFLTVRPGQNYKSIEQGSRSDYNEMIGGIGYQWKWGDISLIKDRLVWGNSTEARSNILSSKAPSFATLYFRLYPAEWLDFQYIHGWLVSEVLDSARTYLTPNGNRKIYTNKNLAANFFTVRSNWNIDFTFGNSIIYSDDGFQPQYFIPFMFFKSVDHTYSGTGSNELGQNSQFFFDFSFRVLKGVHFYTSVFIDEISFSNFWDSENHTNIFSIKGGATYYNIIPNLHLTAEYTRTNPWTYRHQIESTTFASNNFNLGHFMGENADEIYLRLKYQPWRNLSMAISVSHLRKGPEHEYEIIDGNANVTGLDFMQSVNWQETMLAFDANWQIINDVHVFLRLQYLENEGESNYSPEYLRGTTITGEAGFRILR